MYGKRLSHRKTVTVKGNMIVLYEPCSKKTGLRGFRPGPTQTGLHSNRRWLEV